MKISPEESIGISTGRSDPCLLYFDDIKIFLFLEASLCLECLETGDCDTKA